MFLIFAYYMLLIFYCLNVEKVGNTTFFGYLTVANFIII